VLAGDSLKSRPAVENILSTLAEPLGMLNMHLANLARLGSNAELFFIFL
jgi:hypothetical protein